MSNTPSPSSSSSGGVQYSFLTEWWDAAASLVRKYNLFFFTLDQSIEMYDIKNRRTFLKRVVYPSVSLKDLYPGAQVSIYGRLLKIIDFADEFTTSTLGAVKTKSVAILKPAAVPFLGSILSTITSKGLSISRLTMVQLKLNEAAEFFGDVTNSARVNELIAGPIVAVELVGINAQQALLNFGDNSSLQDVLLSSSTRSSEVESEFFFSNRNLSTTAVFQNSTLALIKPHAIEQAGNIISAISSSPTFSISAVELFHLDRQAAEEFLEVYKGIVPEYHNMVEQLTSGPCIAIEVKFKKEAYGNTTSSEGNSIVELFREFAGPSDPEIGKKLRPNTLRAKFGVSKVKNAIHVTDLPEDGILETEYFFKLLHNHNSK